MFFAITKVPPFTLEITFTVYAVGEIKKGTVFPGYIA